MSRNIVSFEANEQAATTKQRHRTITAWHFKPVGQHITIETTVSLGSLFCLCLCYSFSQLTLIQRKSRSTEEGAEGNDKKDFSRTGSEATSEQICSEAQRCRCCITPKIVLRLPEVCESDVRPSDADRPKKDDHVTLSNSAF